MLVLYENIKNRRSELHLTQEELAEKLGYKGKSMICKIEKGLVDLPQSKITAFADALLTTPGDLMGWTEDEESRAKRAVTLSSITLRLQEDAEMVEALDVYFKMSPEKKRHVIEEIHFLGGT